MVRGENLYWLVGRKKPATLIGYKDAVAVDASLAVRLSTSMNKDAPPQSSSPGVLTDFRVLAEWLLDPSRAVW